MIDKNDGLTLECDSIHSRNCSLSYSFIVLYFERPPIAFRLNVVIRDICAPLIFLSLPDCGLPYAKVFFFY